MTGPYKATADRFAAVVTKANADERTLEIFCEFVHEAEVSEMVEKLDIPISSAIKTSFLMYLIQTVTNISF